MTRIMICALAALSLSACGTSYQIAQQCEKENPTPESLKAGSLFGLLGVGIAYMVDGDAISDAHQRQEECAKEKKAALEAQK